VGGLREGKLQASTTLSISLRTSLGVSLGLSKISPPRTWPKDREVEKSGNNSAVLIAL